MKVQESEFIREKKPLLKKLLGQLLQRYTYASVLAEDSRSKYYSVSRKNMGVGEDDLGTSRGFVVKVSDGKHYGEYSFNQITEEEIDRICRRVEETMEASSRVLPEGMGEREFQVPQEEETVFCAGTDYETDPEEMGDQAILNLLEGIRDKGLAVSGEILDCRVFCTYQKYTKLFLSRKKDLEQNVMHMTGAVSFAAAKGEEIKDYYRAYSCLGGAEVLSGMEADVEKGAGITLELLKSEPMVPGEYPCICAPEVTGMIVHEAFGHGVEMDMFVKKRALAEKYVGEYVASELVTMHDGAFAAM